MPHVDLDFVNGPQNYFVILQDQSLTVSGDMVSAFDYFDYRLTETRLWMKLPNRPQEDVYNIFCFLSKW